MSTHQQLLYHVVFSTKNRKPYLRNEEFRESVFAYLAGVAKEIGGYALIVGGYFEHAHLLVRIPAKVAVSNFVGKVKGNTSKHINETSQIIKKFGWQDGFGAFTVSPSQKNSVYQYIANQMQHHAAESFESEHLRLLDKHEVQYDPRFVWESLSLGRNCADPSGLKSHALDGAGDSLPMPFTLATTAHFLAVRTPA
ncbi:Transposase IS200 like protein [Roseimaritima multifibrata]|uniref:Transposase IS200 like protein n=1 Tax=Roseimaritima multifibrata TaxID=1930274 RepID=A0A517MBM0_9BACT|nr:IS200/IS605 family transposase [Roseimaritima multifibrata]QDS92280.1 Transposase IS200 like protein [Roseimaritima multifibrata]